MYSEIISTPALKSYETMSLSIFKAHSLFDIPICPLGIFPNIGEEKRKEDKRISCPTGRRAFIKPFIEAVPKALNYGINAKVLQTFLSAVVNNLKKNTIFNTTPRDLSSYEEGIKGRWESY